MIDVEAMELSSVPSDVISLTRPGTGSVMKQWVSEAKAGASDGLAWLAYEHPDGFLTNPRLVGWAAVVDGELSVYVRPSERRRGIGSQLIEAIGTVEMLTAKPHNRVAENFFQKNGIPF
jgi:GNAT superfamily N-acetyltransferase